MNDDTRKLIDDYLDGELTPEGETSLLEWLSADPEHVRIFVRETHAHRLLRDLLVARGLQSSLQEEPEPVEDSAGWHSRGKVHHFSTPSRSILPWAAAIAASALLALTFLLFYLFSGGETPEPRSVAGEIKASPEDVPQPDTVGRKPSEKPELPPAEVKRWEPPHESKRAHTPESPPEPPPAPRLPTPPDRPPEEPPPKPPAEPVHRTVVLAAEIQSLHGKVFVLQEGEKKPALARQPLGTGQGILTEGSESAISMRLPDGTRIVLGADTLVRGIVERPDGGKTVAIQAGRLEAEVLPQTAGRPLLFVTPQAEARVVGTRLELSVTAESTRLDVGEGQVRFTRRADRKSVDVTAGCYSMVSVNAAAQMRVYDKGKLSQERVNAAIDRGVKFLKQCVQKTGAFKDGDSNRRHQFEELVSLTMLHAAEVRGTRVVNDPIFRIVLGKSLQNKLNHTYNVTLLAMTLEKLGASGYRGKIGACAQFLADAQCKNGQWNYTAGNGGPCTETPTWSKVRPTVSSGGPLRRQSVRISKKRWGGDSGDNSNSQYAALGIRACAESGFVVQDQVVERAKKWWESTQGGDGGWGYKKGSKSYASMTHGAVGSLAIYNGLLGESAKSGKPIERGIDWIGKNFNVTRNHGSSGWAVGWHLYNLYALERAGRLLDVETFGSHSWYIEGAEYLLKNQKPDGSWDHPEKDGNFKRLETRACFAILFLCRATMPVATESRR